MYVGSNAKRWSAKQDWWNNEPELLLIEALSGAGRTLDYYKVFFIIIRT